MKMIIRCDNCEYLVKANKDEEITEKDVEKFFINLENINKLQIRTEDESTVIFSEQALKKAVFIFKEKD